MRLDVEEFGPRVGDETEGRDLRVRESDLVASQNQWHQEVVGQRETEDANLRREP